jgi:hypothetical protein
VIGRAFAVVFSRMSSRMRCPVLHVSLPEVYYKTAEINRFTVLQILFEGIQLCQTVYGRKVWADHGPATIGPAIIGSWASNHWSMGQQSLDHVQLHVSM